MEYNWLIWGYIVLVNIYGFSVMGWDKYKAKRGGRRVPERRFFLTGLIFGAPGIYLAMRFFRHKTKHKAFIYGIPVLIILNISVLVYFLQKF
ncbi:MULTISPECIES: DUF1294 domain-containing protein [Dehalobacter]|uniref:DUF1294 domain-containing protein n=2 Tax=Dehalobacter restrictus TaxID=55583 RepID=A0A857DMH1_9FIRM|nr:MULTISPECIES: DUF1294 domain-containing protein [Dehalobacter]AHF10944.1 hypothetical protein DEHRE_13425 [Dehalobacter restrictus DSM 9455]MDJ0307113.1 DUF1294 domain-containing protein [Dehalobacter sp.]OCZ49646.1 hypothetical protein A7D23_02100 [Dehalobacter sp. TeCB1]QHA01589.1 DUF1294 domain-containing protein [Dehalobacter restrictus]